MTKPEKWYYTDMMDIIGNDYDYESYRFAIRCVYSLYYPEEYNTDEVKRAFLYWYIANLYPELDEIAQDLAELLYNKEIEWSEEVYQNIITNLMEE